MASGRAARPPAPPFIDPLGYSRHRPEATLLDRLVERHYPEFVATREVAGRPLPKYVQEEFDASATLFAAMFPANSLGVSSLSAW